MAVGSERERGREGGRERERERERLSRGRIGYTMLNNFITPTSERKSERERKR